MTRRTVQRHPFPATDAARHTAGRTHNAASFPRRCRGDCQAGRACPRHKARRAFPRCRRQRCRSTRPPSARPRRGSGSKSVPGSRPWCNHTQWKAAGSPHGQTCAAERIECQDTGFGLRNAPRFSPSSMGVEELVVIGPVLASPISAGPFQRSGRRCPRHESPTPEPKLGLAGTTVPATRRAIRRRVEIAGRFQPGEANQCPNFTQLLGQDDLLERSLCSLRAAEPLFSRKSRLL